MPEAQRASQNPSTSPDPEAPLREFVEKRRNDTLVLIITEAIGLSHLLSIQHAIGSRNVQKLDVILVSSGGDPHIAYQMIALLRRHAKEIHGWIPWIAKSAATLICLGIDRLMLDEVSHLGPLDVQVFEEHKKKPGKGKHISALNPFSTLDCLQRFAVETMDVAYRAIGRHTDLDHDEMVKLATHFASVVVGPLIEKVSADTLGSLGQFRRDLEIARAYGHRILKRYKKWGEDKSKKALNRLVDGYPSHSYVIDQEELAELGFDARLYPSDLLDTMRKVFAFAVDVMYEGENFIKFFERPADPVATDPAPPAPASIESTSTSSSSVTQPELSPAIGSEIDPLAEASPNGRSPAAVTQGA